MEVCSTLRLPAGGRTDIGLSYGTVELRCAVCLRIRRARRIETRAQRPREMVQGDGMDSPDGRSLTEVGLEVRVGRSSKL